MDQSIFKSLLRQSSCVLRQGKKLNKYFNYFRSGIRVCWMTVNHGNYFIFLCCVWNRYRLLRTLSVLETANLLYSTNTTFCLNFHFFFFFNEMFFKLGDELNHLLLGHLWHFSLPQIALHCQLQKWKELKQQKQQHTFWIQTLFRKLSDKACFFDRRDANTRKEFLFPSLFSNY